MKIQVVGRAVQAPSPFRLGLQNDHRMETVEFSLPKLYGTADLSHAIFYLAYLSPSGAKGILPLKKTIAEEEIVLSWEVGSEVMREQGCLQAQLIASGLESRLWHSGIFYCTVCGSIQADISAAQLSVGQKEALTYSASPRIQQPSCEEPITIAERQFVIPAMLQSIAVQNDEMSETVTILLPRFYDGHDLSAYTLSLRTVSSGGQDDIFFTQKQIFENEISVEWTLRPPQTSYAGKLELQFVVSGENFCWQSEPSSVNIIHSLSADPVIPMTPSFLDGIYAEMERLIGSAKGQADRAAEIANNLAGRAEEAALSAKENADYAKSVGDTLTQKLNAGEFIGPRGEKGERGPKGDTGPSDVAALTAHNTASSAHADIRAGLQNPNLIVNGGFQVWQRGEEFLANTAAKMRYTADRWLADKGTKVSKGAAGGLIAEMSVQYDDVRTNDLVTTDMWESFKQYGATVSISLEKLAGSSEAVSITTECAFYNDENYNLHESIIYRGTQYTGTFTRTFSPEFFQSLPSVPTRYRVVVMNHSGGQMNVRMNWAKLEYGTTPTRLLLRPYSEELALCRWYFERTRQMLFSPHTQSSVHTYVYVDYAPKRVVPTLTAIGVFKLYSPETNTVITESEAQGFSSVTTVQSVMRFARPEGQTTPSFAYTPTNAAYVDIDADVY